MIAGGLGGQGMSIAKWMGRRGAKNLLLISRQGQQTTKASNFLREMHAKGIRVETPACDIADASALRNAMEFATSKMPPIKGCIQAAMVIRVSQSHLINMSSF